MMRIKKPDGDVRKREERRGEEVKEQTNDQTHTVLRREREKWEEKGKRGNWILSSTLSQSEDQKDDDTVCIPSMNTVARCITRKIVPRSSFSGVSWNPLPSEKGWRSQPPKVKSSSEQSEMIQSREQMEDLTGSAVFRTWDRKVASFFGSEPYELFSGCFTLLFSFPY